MSEAVKTRHISIKFKPRTPVRIIREVKKQYSDYIDDGDEYVDYFKTDLHKKISASMTPGDYLRHYREAHGLTQKEFAAKIGTRINYLSDMENGHRAISKAMAKKLAVVFNTSPAVFI
jgi:DNA-binding transcriptional regulator YiaG